MAIKKFYAQKALLATNQKNTKIMTTAFFEANATYNSSRMTR
jgi:hypothetical protein